jgi:hypothetical protein
MPTADFLGSGSINYSMHFKRFSLLYYERLAKGWERWVTIAIVALLLVPIPFVRFEAWPDGNLLWQEPLMPWSRFQICYTSFPDRRAVDDVYRFHWNGLRLETDPKLKRPLAFCAAGEPLLKWQDRPEMPLTELYTQGDLLRVRTSWQPLLLWPLRMLKESWQPGLGLTVSK